MTEQAKELRLIGNLVKEDEKIDTVQKTLLFVEDTDEEKNESAKPIDETLDDFLEALETKSNEHKLTIVNKAAVMDELIVRLILSMKAEQQEPEIAVEVPVKEPEKKEEESVGDTD